MSASGSPKSNPMLFQEVIASSSSDEQALKQLKDDLGLKNDIKRELQVELQVAGRSREGSEAYLKLKAEYEAVLDAEKKLSSDATDESKISLLQDKDLPKADKAALLLAVQRDFIDCVVLLLDNGASHNMSELERGEVISLILEKRKARRNNKSFDFTFVINHSYETALGLLGYKYEIEDISSVTPPVLTPAGAAPPRSLTPSQDLIDKLEAQFGGDDGYGDYEGFGSESVANSRAPSPGLELKIKRDSRMGDGSHLRMESIDSLSFADGDLDIELIGESLGDELPETPRKGNPGLTVTIDSAAPSRNGSPRSASVVTAGSAAASRNATPILGAPRSAAGSRSAAPSQVAPMSAAGSRSSTPGQAVPRKVVRSGSASYNRQSVPVPAKQSLSGITPRPVVVPERKRHNTFFHGQVNLADELLKGLTVELSSQSRDGTPCATPKGEDRRDSTSSEVLRVFQKMAEGELSAFQSPAATPSQASHRGSASEALVSASHSQAATPSLSRELHRDSVGSAISLPIPGEEALVSALHSPAASPSLSLASRRDSVDSAASLPASAPISPSERKSDVANGFKARSYKISSRVDTPSQLPATVFSGKRVRVRLATKNVEIESPSLDM